MHALVPKMFFPVDGFPIGPRDRTGEPLAKPGLKNTATVTMTGVDLTAKDVEGELPNCFYVRPGLTSIAFLTLLCVFP